MKAVPLSKLPSGAFYVVKYPELVYIKTAYPGGGFDAKNKEGDHLYQTDIDVLRRPPSKLMVVPTWGV